MKDIEDAIWTAPSVPGHTNTADALMKAHKLIAETGRTNVKVRTKVKVRTYMSM